MTRFFSSWCSRLLPIALVAFVLEGMGSSIGTPGYAAPASGPISASTPTTRREAGLPNFAQVAPGLYRGAAPTPEGWKRLHEMGVRTVIDLRIEKKGQKEAAEAATEYGFHRVRIPLGTEAPTKRQVATFLQMVNDPGQQPVYVHCHYGADRTGAMIGIYRVTQQGWTFDQAYAEMRRYGFKPFLTDLKGAVRSRATR